MTFDEIHRRLEGVDTTSLCDANKAIRTMDAGLRPVRTDLKLLGRARTVSCFNDFLTVLKALLEAEAGEVLVVDGRGGLRALAGELFTTEAARKGLGGIVVDGAVRDTARMRTLDIPVYSRSVFPVSGTAETLFETQITVTCGGVTVNPGDLVFGDRDGIIVATLAELEDLLPIAEQIQSKEAEVLDSISKGGSLFDHLNYEEVVAGIRTSNPAKLRFSVRT